MTRTSVYIFAGSFENIEEACLCSEPQREPEQDDSVSDEEYIEWEERNPTRKFKNNVNSYLDENFIETFQAGSFNY